MRSPQISAAFGREQLISAAALISVNTILSGVTMLLMLLTPYFRRKMLIGAAVLIRVNSVHFLMHCGTYLLPGPAFTNKLLVNDKIIIIIIIIIIKTCEP